MEDAGSLQWIRGCSYHEHHIGGRMYWVSFVVNDVVVRSLTLFGFHVCVTCGHTPVCFYFVDCMFTELQSSMRSPFGLTVMFAHAGTTRLSVQVFCSTVLFHLARADPQQMNELHRSSTCSACDITTSKPPR